MSMDLHDAELENAQLRRDLNDMTVRIHAVETLLMNQAEHACRCNATRMVVADRATCRSNRRWSPSPARPAQVIVRGGNGTHDEPYRLVEIEDRPDPAPAWWVDGDGDDENEDVGEGSGEGPAPREESPEV